MCFTVWNWALPNRRRSSSWQNAEWVALAMLPGPWLLFSLTYARGNYREFLKKWSFVLVVAFLVPVALSIFFWDLTISDHHVQ